MSRAPRFVNTGDHVELSSGYPCWCVAVTYEDDPGWLHERLLLWVIEPDRFVVLTPDGDTYEEMRDTWLAPQVMTGRLHFPIGPANVVAFTDPLEDTEMLRHITEGRLEGETTSAAESPTVSAAPASCFNWSGELKALSARVSHRLRGRCASVRREILPVVASEGIAHDRNPREEIECSGNDGTEVANDEVDFSPCGGNVWVVCDPEDPDFGKIMELDGRSSVSGDYGLAERSNGFFSAVKRRSLTTLPSLLSDSINCLQKLKGTGDTVRKQVHAVEERLKGLRERLAADPAEGEQTVFS